jgi:hypothetical protein
MLFLPGPKCFSGEIFFRAYRGITLAFWNFLNIIVMIIFPEVFRRNRVELGVEDRDLLREYKDRIKARPFSSCPNGMTADKQNIWSRANSEFKEIMVRRVY